MGLKSTIRLVLFLFDNMQGILARWVTSGFVKRVLFRGVCCIFSMTV